MIITPGMLKQGVIRQFTTEFLDIGRIAVVSRFVDVDRDVVILRRDMFHPLSGTANSKFKKNIELDDYTYTGRTEIEFLGIFSNKIDDSIFYPSFFNGHFTQLYLLFLPRIWNNRITCRSATFALKPETSLQVVAKVYDVLEIKTDEQIFCFNKENL